MRTVRSIAFVVGLITLAGCHSFFCVKTVVTDAITGQPVSDARATLVLDKGVGEPTGERTTGSDGALEMWMNEPTDAWATLTVEKEGYHPWSAQFKERPRSGLVIRLVPEKNR